MKNKIIDLLELLLDSFKDEFELSSNDLVNFLNKDNKVNYMEALEREAEDLENVKPESKNSFRYLLESEKMFFTKEAQGELIQLQSMGLISGKEIEQLIETAIFRDFRLIDRETLRQLLPTIIIEINGNLSNSIMLGNNSVN